jgi:hypothetical protein
LATPRPPGDLLLRLGVGPAPEGKVRFRLSCALCHYSLDIDVDGKPDIHSTVRGQQTPGSPWKPEDGWGIGNQDLHIGWLLALSANIINSQVQSMFGHVDNTPLFPGQRFGATDLPKGTGASTELAIDHVDTEAHGPRDVECV